jgi:hypothetical protein
MTTRNSWPKIGKRRGVPRQPVKTKDIDVRESGWYQHASDWKKAEMLANENSVSRRKI